MTDIVATAREEAAGWAGATHTITGPKVARILNEAADEIEKLRAALEPFADVPGEGNDDYADETEITTKFGRTTNYALRLKDFRHAQAVLNSHKCGGG